MRPRRLQFLVLVLQLVELPVDSALREQFLMRAHFAQLAFVHDEDPVCPLDGGEAVRNDDRSTAFDHALQRRANANFGFGIDARGRFVEDQDPRIVRQRAGEIDELLLAGGKTVAPLAQRLVESPGSDGMKSPTLTSSAAPSMRSSVIQSVPRRILSAIVPLKRNGSCSTTPKCRRSCVRSCSRTSTPSTRMLPCWMS